MGEVRRHEERPTGWRRPLVLRAGIVVGIVVVALVALSVVNVFGPNGPSIVEKASAALATPLNSILHMTTTAVQDNGDGSTASWADETWQTTSAPFASRRIETTSGSGPAETAYSESGLYQLYDPGSDTVYAYTAAAGSEEAKIAKDLASTNDAFEAFKAEALQLLASKDAKVEKDVDYEGRPAIRITGTTQPKRGAPAAGTVTYIVDANSYDPLEWQSNGTTGGVTMKITYETLPATADTLPLIDLLKQHPGAKVIEDAAEYQKATERLFAKG
jgi:outer membrane lipoprotein-sorting protein